MRVALLSDVHANLTALEAVLAALPSVDELWVMGDTVGYGPDPSEVLALLQARNAYLVAGNHDRAVATGEGLELFNPVAAEAARLHVQWLGADERASLAALPLTATRSGVTLFHGSLREPLWEYVFDAAAAAPTLRLSTTARLCCGHTHMAALFQELPDGRVVARAARDGDRDPLVAKTIINPGSVGQPRDHDPRAAWALLDTEDGVVFRRTAYDIAATQERMRARGLPSFLVERLAVGV